MSEERWTVMGPFLIGMRHGAMSTVRLEDVSHIEHVDNAGPFSEGVTIFMPMNKEIEGMTARQAWRVLREAGNTKFKGEARQDFGTALEALREGRRVARAGWNGMWLRLRFVAGATETAPGNAVHRPYIEMCDAQGFIAPWPVAQTDILAEDWGEVS